MSRVVFTKIAEPAVDWSKIESRLQDISASSLSFSDLPIAPSAGLANDPPVTAPGEGVISQSAPQDITTEFQAAIAASDPSNRLTTR